MAGRNANGEEERGAEMAPDQATAQAIREMSNQVGRLCGSVEALQTGQAALKADLRADVAGLHSKIESYAVASTASVENLYRNGTARCLAHANQEERLRQVEDWKITHETENKLAAQEAGGAAGGKRGGLYGVVAVAAGLFIEWWIKKNGG